MEISPLIPMLSDGEFRSGQDLANALGISRTAVWKQLNKLGSLGLQVESIKGRGYRIPGGVDLLSKEEIQEALLPATTVAIQDIILHAEIDSTNAQLMRRVAEGAAHGLVCTAELQSAGRGRLGRSWVSPFAGNVYLSMSWEFSRGAAALEGLSLAVGVAVANALQGLDIDGVTLKWPNDILHDGAKLGGVLLEMAGDAAGLCQVVVGIGLNVKMSAAASVDISQDWVDLHGISGGEAPRRSKLIAALLNELAPMMASFEETGFAPWRSPWTELDAFSGQPVAIFSGETQKRGICRGVDARGALQLETAAGVESIFGGEISVRRAS